MALIINIIAAVILFVIPLKAYQNRNNLIVRHPMERDVFIRINYDLYFLVFSVLTAMFFLGPLSLIKYVFWIIFLIYLALSGHIRTKTDPIVWFYLIFIAWAVISAILFSSVKFQALMMLIKYVLPLFYLWLGYSAINDSDDLMFFFRNTVVGMCVYALIIGGFSAKFLGPLYAFLNFTSGGLMTSYASLADYYSGLIVVPIGLFIITKEKKWIYATLWVILSTILETVRTGLGGIFLASSFFLVTVFRGKAIPWIAGLSIAAVLVVFTVPSFRDKMFKNENVSMSTFSVSDANFDNIQSNAREFIWEANLRRFHDPHPVTGSGLGESVEWMKNQPGLKLIHSDYVQILCDLGYIGIALFGLFVLITLFSVVSSVWVSHTPLSLKITGGMALGSCAGTFFSMAFDNVVTYTQQSYVIPFIFIGIFMKIRDLTNVNSWK